MPITQQASHTILASLIACSVPLDCSAANLVIVSISDVTAPLWIFSTMTDGCFHHNSANVPGSTCGDAKQYSAHNPLLQVQMPETREDQT